MIQKEMPKTYDFKSTEERLYAWWEKHGYFKPRGGKHAERFVISMPPPNVTGGLHMGHAITASAEDLMIRYRRMRGLKTLWVPGSDHAGIATQLQVERLLRSEGTSRGRGRGSAPTGCHDRRRRPDPGGHDSGRASGPAGERREPPGVLVPGPRDRLAPANDGAVTQPTAGSDGARGGFGEHGIHYLGAGYALSRAQLPAAAEGPAAGGERESVAVVFGRWAPCRGTWVTILSI